jgi:demethylmenaquinone methyltransferase/2-methoxy-6-polyprenyl-1,4-benzoquinol methylase
MALEDRIATPAGKRRYVRSLFARIADRYDLITVLLSYGRDRQWKRRLMALAAPTSTERILDLATGTGDIAWAAAAHSPHVVALDLTERMIELARRKSPARRRAPGEPRLRPRPLFVVGDMTSLPFTAESFDLITIGYGLRNVPDLARAIDELLRVLKPGARAVSLDFNRPANRGVRAIYLAYLTVVGSILGWVLHRDPDTYRYIAASIRTYPGAEGVAALMRERGFARVAFLPVLGGLMTIHQGFKA